MAKWVKLRGGGLRCAEHGSEFTPPRSCPQCEVAEPVDDDGVGDLPYIPGLPTPIEDERAFRTLSRSFLESAEATDIATVAVKYAELGLRALKAAADMGERRISDWNDERRQIEIAGVKSKSTPRRK